MKSILLTSKSPSNNHLLSSVGSHNNHRKNDSNRVLIESEEVFVENKVNNGSVIENFSEKEQLYSSTNNKLLSHSNNIKKQVIRNKIIAKNDDKLKHRSPSDNINIAKSGGNNNNNNNYNDFLLTSTESHPLIKSNDNNDSTQKTSSKFLNLHSKNGTTLIFQRKNCLQSKQQLQQQTLQQQLSSGTNVSEELKNKKESFKKRQSLQWPISSAATNNKLDNRIIRHHSWYDDLRYPNPIEEEFPENSVSFYENFIIYFGGRS